MVPPPWTTRRGVIDHESDVSTASMARGLVTTSEWTSGSSEAVGRGGQRLEVGRRHRRAVVVVADAVPVVAVGEHQREVVVVEIVAGGGGERVRLVVVLPAVGVGGADAGVRAVVGEAAVDLLAEVVEGVALVTVSTNTAGDRAADRVGLPAGRDAEAPADRRRGVDLRVNDGDPFVARSMARGRTSGARRPRSGLRQGRAPARRRRSPPG